VSDYDLEGSSQTTLLVLFQNAAGQEARFMQRIMRHVSFHCSAECPPWFTFLTTLGSDADRDEFMNFVYTNNLPTITPRRDGVTATKTNPFATVPPYYIGSP
jgi:hypothetical protein